MMLHINIILAEMYADICRAPTRGGVVIWRHGTGARPLGDWGGGESRHTEKELAAWNRFHNTLNCDSIESAVGDYLKLKVTYRVTRNVYCTISVTRNWAERFPATLISLRTLSPSLKTGQYVSSKRCYLPASLYSVTTQNNTVIFTSVRTSDLSSF
jgi:hypothetical protein